MTPDASQPVSNPPRVVVLAGPNGAGKSTTAPAILQGALHVNEFVNADQIAVELSAIAPETMAFEAGRAMLARLQELASQRIDFAFETTLASRTFAPWLQTLSTSGYLVLLVFVWLPNPEAAIARVSDRVRRGGHNIPEDVIRRRYRGGIQNFFTLYQPLADRWHMIDNSDATPTVVAEGCRTIVESIRDPKTWALIKEQCASHD
jgi:predicted ABC-type ATPase